ncbi:A24 family peptidase [Rhodopirellula halodulae]|uniref:A24 family peptidase n=1 Tax=Rhodopirellula halodulae TaxID=2894198 RepID=UPI0028F451A0|nr:prepilin peptidase [Rhodopirellula sp. JC737]
MSRRRSPYRSLAIGLLAAYLLGSAAYVWLSAQWIARWHSHFRVLDLLAPRANDVVIFTFFLVVGASIGSFLNVVVWRLPQKLNVNGHSFCPRCRNRLRARDNVPVFGWLWLGGRCRDCRLPISSRYPIVETLVGITIALVGVAELMQWSLPYWDGNRQPLWFAAPAWDANLLCLILYHIVALSTAWAMGLIRYDRNALPSRLTLFAAATLIGGMFALPQTMVVPWQWVSGGIEEISVQWPPQAWWVKDTDPMRGGLVQVDAAALLTQIGMRILTALVAAGFFARVLAKSFCPAADMKLDPLGASTRRLIDLTILLAVPSVVVGWQATMGVILIAAAISKWLQTREFTHSRDSLGRFAVSLPVAVAIQLLLWRGLVASQLWPSEQASQIGLIVPFFAILTIPLWLNENEEIPAPEGEEIPEEPNAESDADSDELVEHVRDDQALGKDPGAFEEGSSAFR